MKVRVFSDLHLDPAFFLPLDVPVTDDEKDTVLVIAGDAAEQRSGCDFLYEMTQRFKAVVHIMGNHEYYNGNLKRTPEKIIDRITEYNGGEVVENYHLLDEDEVVIDDTVFIGATLWTDFDDNNTWTMYLAKDNMNDYRKIRCGPINEPWKMKITPTIIYSVHKQHLDYILFRTKEWEGKGKKVVVVTHHAPSHLSVHPKYHGQSLNGCYYTDLSHVILNRDIDLWCHGHVHTRFDYTLGDDTTRVVCNPRGYKTKKYNEDSGFDPLFTIDL